MSDAWIVTPYHVSAIVSFAEAIPGSSYYYAGKVTPFAGASDEIARKLFAANCASVAFRYNHHEATPTAATLALAAFKYTPLARNLDPLVIIKACHCLSYQSCERDDWEESEAKAIIRDIESAAISALPGYAEAPWGLEPPCGAKG